MKSLIFGDYRDCIKELKDEKDALKKRLEVIQNEYEQLNELVRAWENLNPIYRTTTGGDFRKKIRYSLDKFGTVLYTEYKE